MEQVTAHILIEGRVQGVGYRYFTLQNGQHLGLFGWVCNLTDGRVEVLCQGSKQNIDLLVEKLRQGPSRSDVTDLTCKILTNGVSLKTQFEITPTKEQVWRSF